MEHASEAAHEINVLLELIDITVQDAVSSLNLDREQLQLQKRNLSTILEMLGDYLAQSQSPQRTMELIRDQTGNQLTLTNEILSAIELISEEARDNRQQLQDATDSEVYCRNRRLFNDDSRSLNTVSAT